MTDYTHKTGLCSRCKKNVQASLHLQVMESSAEAFIWKCDGCGQGNPFGDRQFFIPKATVLQYLTKEQVDALPLYVSCPPFSRCARCGKRNAELHHWAPQGIFGVEEANKWPMDYLCRDCHDLWHRMVTPGLKEGKA